MSQSAIIENCKKITVEYILNSIGKNNVVSIILYGSVARNEESYAKVNSKLFLESDLDVMVVIKNKINALKSLIKVNRLSKILSDELRKEWLLSSVNLSITTEERLRSSPPNEFHFSLKLNGKIIYGKNVIHLLQGYGYGQYSTIPVTSLTRMIFGYMISVVRSLNGSGIMVGNITVVGYNAILKSIRKLTLFMLRAIIIKNSIPVNPFNMNDIREKYDFYKGKNAFCNDLLTSIRTIKLSDSIADCSLPELEKRMVMVISQFKTTVAILTGIELPISDLRKEAIFGHYPFIRRLEYSAYIALLNLRSRWTIGLFRFIFCVLYRPEIIYSQYYDLFSSSLDLINPDEYEKDKIFQQRSIWQGTYLRSLKPWKYDKAGG